MPWEGILTLIVTWLASLSPSHSTDKDWLVENVWSKQGEFYSFTASSSRILEECRNNRDRFVELPGMMVLRHELYLDGKPVEVTNGLGERQAGEDYNAVWVSCSRLEKGQLLTWRAITPSLLFAKVRTYPKLSIKWPWYRFVNQTLQLSSVLALVLLSIFSVFVFLGKIELRTVIALGLTGPFFALYIACHNQERYLIPFDYLLCHRLAMGTVWIGAGFFFYCTVRRRLLNANLFKVYVASTLIALSIVGLAESYDTILLGSLIEHPLTIILLGNLSYRFFAHSFRASAPVKYLQGFAILLFVAAAVNEICYAWIGMHLHVLGLGATCGFAFVILSINDDIIQTYRDKVALQERLIFEQERAFLLQKKETAYESVVSTSQMVAHDIRRPFTFMMGVLALVKKAQNIGQVNDVFTKYGGATDEAINSVQAMLKDILSVGGKHHYNFATISLNETLHQSLRAISEWPEVKQIEFLFNLNHGRQVRGDVQQLRRVVENIVSNASKAMMRQGRICISSCEVDRGEKGLFIEVTINNNGEPIDPNQIESIFEPFITGDSKGGRGLGLTICRNIIRDHGGEIFCTSTSSEGTSFSFTLPAQAEAEQFSSAFLEQALQAAEPIVQTAAKDEGRALAEALQAFAQRGRRLRILVVDDEAVYLSLIDRYLSSQPHVRSQLDVVFLQGHETVLDVGYARNFDLIILDVELGGDTNGLRLLANWRNAGYHGKVCIHSNIGGFDLAELAIKAKADMYMPKPLSQELLMQMIGMAVEAATLETL